MNVENMRRLIKHLESPVNPIKFFMGKYFLHNEYDIFTKSEVLSIVEEHACGTTACIAGHAAYLAWKEDDVGADPLDAWADPLKGEGFHIIVHVAREWLDLDKRQTQSLFMGYWQEGPIDEVTKEVAIKHLKSMVDKEVK